jgi:hypothetical protein
LKDFEEKKEDREDDLRVEDTANEIMSESKAKIEELESKNKDELVTRPRNEFRLIILTFIQT